MISYRQEDEILKVFEDGRYIGYVEESMLHMIGKDGYSEPWRNVDSREHIVNAVREYQRGTKNPFEIIEAVLKLIPADKINHDAVRDAKRFMMERVK